ncbi:MAG: aspartyl-tRNA amidotransferase subunit B [Gammaproteobacteria bacterium]|nr:MAG: aspartyl-tRNA amidotransferase subunit B [Gammaproteobacteria bacterium]
MAESALKTRILEDVKAAMRAGDKPRLAALRLITAGLKQKEVDERIELDDAQVIAVLEKMAKQRRESIEQYQRGGREDLVAKEQFELSVIQGYLPEPLGEAELEALIEEALAATGASGIKDMGKVMAHLKPRVAGRADMAQLSARVKARLA